VPVILVTLAELVLCKSIDLPVTERKRGPEHVDKVKNMDSYNSYNGEILLNHVSIIYPSQDNKLTSKITVTRYWKKALEMQNEVLNSFQLTLITYLKVGTKVKIRDSIIRTGDPLNQVIGILGPETKTSRLHSLRIKKGDGVTVVPIDREGLQETIFNNSRTRTFVHSCFLLKANVKGYYPSQIILSRNISIKALKDINIFKETYDKIKSNPGYMSPGTDGETLDEMSNEKLFKLQKSVLN
jgi:hypothetical protein